MHSVVLVIHIILAVSLVAVILLQKSEGGALGGLGGASGGLGIVSGRSVGNFLTRLTAILATCFMVTSLALTLISQPVREKKSILDAPMPQAAQTENKAAEPVKAQAPISAPASAPAKASVPVKAGKPAAPVSKE